MVSKPKAKPKPKPKLKLKAVKRRRLVASALTVAVEEKPRARGKPGPRLAEEQRGTLLALLVGGFGESSIQRYFVAMGWDALASSSLTHYRRRWAKQIAEAKASRIEAALVSGLALKAERIAALKEHAELMGGLRFVGDSKSGRLWNERAWRQTLEDIAVEMGDRKPREGNVEPVIKVYVGLDPDKI